MLMLINKELSRKERNCFLNFLKEKREVKRNPKGSMFIRSNNI